MGEAELAPGTLDPLILEAVSLGPLHGSGVLLRIQQTTHNGLTIAPGALHPHSTASKRSGRPQ